VKFSELVRLLEANGFALVRQKGAVRYYGKAGWPRLIRLDYHGPKEVPTGTCHAILKAAGVPRPGERPEEQQADEHQAEEQP
jgi:predicted RNA binding protein YcfA (HicA-like mRNA interferase family)